MKKILAFLLIVISFCVRASDTGVGHKLRTPAGTIEVVPNNGTGERDTIMANGVPLFRAPSEFIHLIKGFTINNNTVVLFSVNPGGSSTPTDKLYFLVLYPSGRSAVITNEDFESEEEALQIKQEDSEISVFLGYKNGKRKYAFFKDDALVVYQTDSKNDIMKTEDCDRIFNAVTRDCIDLYPGDLFCKNPDLTYDGRSVSTMSTITRAENFPGFNRSELDSFCKNLCSGKGLAKYEDFKKIVCGIR